MKNLSAPFDPQADQVARKASVHKRLSIVGDWLAPIAVWFLVIAMTLAIASVLLGHR